MSANTPHLTFIDAVYKVCAVNATIERTGS